MGDGATTTGDADADATGAGDAVTNTKAIFGLRFNDRIEKIKNTDLPILDRYKTGTTISKEKYLDVFEMQNLTTKEKIEEDKEEVVRTVIKEPTQISLLEIVFADKST